MTVLHIFIYLYYNFSILTSVLCVQNPVLQSLYSLSYPDLKSVFRAILIVNPDSAFLTSSPAICYLRYNLTCYNKQTSVSVQKTSPVFIFPSIFGPP